MLRGLLRLPTHSFQAEFHLSRMPAVGGNCRVGLPFLQFTGWPVRRISPDPRTCQNSRSANLSPSPLLFRSFASASCHSFHPPKSHPSVTFLHSPSQETRRLVSKVAPSTKPARPCRSRRPFPHSGHLAIRNTDQTAPASDHHHRVR